MRNSVKVTIDAYDGTVTFYLADPTDPIVRAYGSAFPGLLKPLDQMPEDLRRHIRYPEDFFAIQARKYATYHMDDPQVFYNREDLWALPRRTIEGRDRDMEPYYTIMRLPGEQKEEFILLTLFNPARRDNMIAWMAARSDPPNYGRLIVYNFPKQKLVYGPRQIDARIDQDPIISQQLALWDQRGSTVIRGSLLAIPIDQSLIYVQPLYLAASEQGALPELRRVIVAYGNQIAMEPTLEQSLGADLRRAARPPDGAAARVAAGAGGARRPSACDRVARARASAPGRSGRGRRTPSAAATGRPTGPSRSVWKRRFARSRSRSEPTSASRAGARSRPPDQRACDGSLRSGPARSPPPGFCAPRRDPGRPGDRRLRDADVLYASTLPARPGPRAPISSGCRCTWPA